MRNFLLSCVGFVFWYYTYETGSVFTAFIFGCCYGLIFLDMSKKKRDDNQSSSKLSKK